MLASGVFIFQHKELTTGAWIVLILIVLFVLILNFSLISALRKKDNSTSKVLHRFVTSIKEPEHEDDQMRKELSERIERLKKNNPPPKD